jgi:hypothetical protein
MLRLIGLSLFAWYFIPSSLVAAPIRGNYVEARTCQVYTGPCFANGEVGLCGKDAIMTWQIQEGTFAGEQLDGLAVAVIVKASDTLGHNGLADAQSVKTVLIVDAAANQSQANALQQFALSQTSIHRRDVAAVGRADIAMHLDVTRLTAELDIRDYARLVTRKARPGDCICSNESAYYPPLAKLKGFVPGVTIEGEVAARPLGCRWSIPDSRTAYIGTFELDTAHLENALVHGTHE